MIEILNRSDQSRKKREFRNPVIDTHLILWRKCSFVTEKEINSLVVKGDLETLKILITTRTTDQNPVIYEYKDGAKSTVLHEAAYYGHLKIIIWYKDVLGFSDINPEDSKSHTPLFWASKQGQIEVAKYYIKNDYMYHASRKITKFTWLLIGILFSSFMSKVFICPNQFFEF